MEDNGNLDDTYNEIRDEDIIVDPVGGEYSRGMSSISFALENDNTTAFFKLQHAVPFNGYLTFEMADRTGVIERKRLHI